MYCHVEVKKIDKNEAKKEGNENRNKAHRRSWRRKNGSCMAASWRKEKHRHNVMAYRRRRHGISNGMAEEAKIAWRRKSDDNKA